MKIVIEDSTFVTLWYHTDNKIVHHKIKPVAPPYTQMYRTQFRRALLRGVELLKEKSACKWLSDDLSSIPLPAHDVEWGEREWAPKAIIAGWHYWAMVLPKDMIAQMAASNITRRLSSAGVTVKMYDNEDDAIAWLDSCGN